jgi:signal transduction histidine kinase
MTGVNPKEKEAFVVSDKTVPDSLQPLEVYHLSHDLRGPLNSILGFSELLMEGIEGPLNENQQADIVAINQSAQNLLRQISNLVDLSKLAADRLNLDVKTVELAALIEKVSTSNFGIDRPEAVTLTTKLPEALPPVRADRDRLEQILVEIIRFGLKRQKSGQITVLAVEMAQEVAIRVVLNQVLLDPEQLAELFELGVHVDATGRSKLGLGGMALPLAQRLAEKQNGRLWAERDEAGRTVFKLRWPVQTEDSK